MIMRIRRIQCQGSLFKMLTADLADFADSIFLTTENAEERRELSHWVIESLGH